MGDERKIRRVSRKYEGEEGLKESDSSEFVVKVDPKMNPKAMQTLFRDETSANWKKAMRRQHRLSY